MENPTSQAAPKKRPGRPVRLLDGKNVMTYLDAQSLETAMALGGGNLSAGIRAALAFCKEDANFKRAKPEGENPA